MPFPAQVDGKFTSNIAGDYKMAINKNSPNQDAAKAFLYWYINSSGYSYDQGGINPVIAGKDAPQYKDFNDAGVQYIQQASATAGNQAWVGQIQDKSNIQLYGQDWPQRIVDAARGASKETLDQIFADLNAKWAAARKDVGAPSSLPPSS